MASINGRSLDNELLSLNNTLTEMINMGLVEEIFYPEEGGAGPIRFRLTTEAPAVEEETWQPEMAVHI
jgi:hypothetical protein